MKYKETRTSMVPGFEGDFIYSGYVQAGTVKECLDMAGLIPEPKGATVRFEELATIGIIPKVIQAKIFYDCAAPINKVQLCTLERVEE